MGRTTLRGFQLGLAAATLIAAAAAGNAQPVFRSAVLSPLTGTNTDATGLGLIADFGSPSGSPDGRPDVVVFSQGQQATLLFGVAGGRLQAGPSTDLLGVIPSAVVSGDWNRDGRADFAVGDSSNFLSFWRGVGDGTFQQVGQPIDLGFLPRSLATADFNRDGRVDLVAVGENVQRTGVGRLLYGNADGSFTAAAETFDTGFGSAAVAVGDLNGDGRLDLAVANEETDEVYVLRGEVGGGFSLLRRLATGQAPVAVALADLNRDGRLEILTANSNSDSVGVLLNQGAGMFSSVREFPVGANAATPRGLALGDVDGDGQVDVLVANNFSFDVAVLRGDGAGGFFPARAFVADAEPLGVLAGDLNGDGRSDAVVLTRGGGSSPTAAVLLSLGNGRLQGVENVALRSSPAQVTVGDVDGDGLPDLLVAEVGSASQPGRARLLSSFGESGFGNPAELLSSGDGILIVAGDFDGDLRLDVALINRNPPSVDVFRGRPGGSFQRMPAVSLAAGTVNAAVGADLDRDGRTDIAVAGQEQSAAGIVAVLRGAANGVLQPGATVQVGDLPLGIDVGDFNNDGIFDLVTANNASSNVSIALGNGDGTFQAATSRAASGGPRSVAVADFDRDGRDDLAVSTIQPPGVNVFFGDGTGRFPDSLARPLSVGAGEVPAAVVARDVDGNGTPDILVAGETNNSVRLFLRSRDSSRAFQSADVVGVNRRPVSLVAADFDGDGRYDVAAATTSPAPTTSVLTNVGASAIMRGDANGDGKKSAADFVALTRRVSEPLPVRIEDSTVRGANPVSPGADADGNGWISALDLASLPGRLFR